MVDLTSSIMVESFKLYNNKWHLVISILFPTTKVTRFFVYYMFFRSTDIFSSICMYMYYLYFVYFVYLPCGLWASLSNIPFIGGSWTCGLYFSCYPPSIVDRQFPVVLIFIDVIIIGGSKLYF